jgi:aspartate/methionine/tyrosine aminotransferase
MHSMESGTKRLESIVGFHIDKVAAAAGNDPDMLRLENLDTDVPPPTEAIEATRAAIGTDEANSWLPFSGLDDLKYAVARHIVRRGGPRYDARNIVITCGEGDAMLDAMYCLTNPGDEVLVTDPTYAGMVNRVRLVGAEPRFVPLSPATGRWRLDASCDEWDAVASVCRARDIWLVYWAGFEGVLFDGLGVIHPAAADRMRDRTVTIGAVSLEQRMIGWRVGWIVAPDDIADRAATVHSYNGLVASGFAQIGARAALDAPDDGLHTANAEWQRRRDEMLRQLDGLPVVAPSGAWSMLLDVAALGVDPMHISALLLKHKVAATPMVGWGDQVAGRHVRLVFSNEPVERLKVLGDRVRSALTEAGASGLG